MHSQSPEGKLRVRPGTQDERGFRWGRLDQAPDRLQGRVLGQGVDIVKEQAEVRGQLGKFLLKSNEVVGGDAEIVERRFWMAVRRKGMPYRGCEMKKETARVVVSVIEG